MTGEMERWRERWRERLRERWRDDGRDGGRVTEIYIYIERETCLERVIYI